MLYSYFWALPLRQHFLFRRFGTFCSILIGRSTKEENFLPTYIAYEDGKGIVFRNVGI